MRFLLLGMVLVLVACEPTVDREKLEDKKQPVVVTDDFAEDSVDVSGDEVETNEESLSDSLELPSGVEILFNEHGSGERIQAGDIVLFNFKLFNLRDQLLDGTHKLGFPIAVKQGLGIAVPGMDKAFLKMRVGDKARITVPSKLAFGEDFENSLVKKGEDVYYEVTIEGLPETVDTSGVKLTVFHSEGGSKIESRDIVGIDFFAYREDGTLFDFSRRNKSSFEFRFGDNQVIKGLELAISKMKVGDKAYIEIPSSLGYGEQGLDELVPPNMDLIYMVTVDYKK